MRLRGLALLLTFAASIAASTPASRGQAAAPAAPARDDIVNTLSKFDSGPDLDIAALKQTVLEKSRSRSRKEPEPSKRPLVVPDIVSLPTFNFNIQFDVDTPVILPESYETVGRLADALVNAPLLPYTFLIVGHSQSTGKREANVILSQRRADAIRDVLINTFKISSKRLQSLGLGEEQFIDQAHPTSSVNQQIQVVTIGKLPEEAAPPAATPAAKKSAKKKKK
ncbi:MAG TPA: OmpA family protein [Bradyrhizobium sp.]|uniref:OmpA family protein n=1 Tax=Bradyrhizobium sp. TaxID=376 RepID=UPI002C2B8A27|nr:OmpA family protein [Bradyrhizobium sp.]HLZ05150.1 OmpA family protein [Bradyrhizobium sp.]